MNNRPWNSPQYKAWRLSVKRRDRFCCKMPDCKSKLRLNAHHIRTWAQFPELRYVLSNGITLCKKCHKSIEGKEESFEALFLGLVNPGAVSIKMSVILQRRKDNHESSS